MNVRSGHLQPLSLFCLASLLIATAAAQQAKPAPAAAANAPIAQPATPDATVVGDNDQPAKALPPKSTAAQRTDAAWSLLSDAAGDDKHPQNRVQALAALGILRTPRAEKLISAAMSDPDLDVRTAAALAAGQSGNRNLTTPLRNLLDDKEPQVAFTAAMTLWKMGDRSGEDILMAVADGDRSANANLMNGTKHTIQRDLHNPAMLARMGALEGAQLALGPFGFGITAYEYIRKNGGDVARSSAIEQLAEERTPPVHKELIAALGDKDPSVRAAAARGLVDYRDTATSLAIYPLFADAKLPVRLTAAAAYLRTTGTSGPSVTAMATSTHAQPK